MTPFSALPPLILAAGQAVTQVAIMVLAGHVLARHNYLPHALQKGISRLTIQFFLPCLLLASTAVSVTPENFVSLYPIPLYFAVFAGTAYLVAQVSTRWLLSTTPSQRSFVTANLMFSNTNSLPIALLQSLVMSMAFTWLKRHPKDDMQAVAARGIGYMVFYAFFGNMVRWSYGQWLLMHDKDAIVVEKIPDVPVVAEERVPWLIERLSARPRLQRIVASTWHGLCVAYSYISKVLSAPFIGALIGLVIALTPFIRTHLVKPGTFLNTAVFIGIKKCGEASVPVMLVCLGAQLSALMNCADPIKPDIESNHRSYPSYRAVLALIVVCRLLILPALVVGTVLLTHRWFSVAADPTFVVSMLLAGSCPTAINLMVICQAEGMFEIPMGKSLLYQYVGALGTLSLWCTLFLWLVQS